MQQNSPSRLFVMPMLALLAAAMLVGCPSESKPPADSPEQTVQAPPTEDKTAPPTVPAIDVDSITLVAADKPYIAANGRSPIPAEGETIDKLIPAERLAEPETGVAPPEGQIIPWKQAPKHLGYELTTEGKIVKTHLLKSGYICFLNFHPDFRNNLSITLFNEAFPAGDIPPDDYYLDKTIRVTGLVKLHKGRPQIEVRDASQITIVE